MLVKTIFLIFTFAQGLGYGPKKQFRISNDGWKPLLHPPVQQKISNFGFVPEPNGNLLYATPSNAPKRSIVNSQSTFGKGSDNIHTVSEKKMEYSTKDLEALIDKKIGKSLESFFVKFNNMLEAFAMNATKNIHIHHRGVGEVPVAEAGNEGVPQQLRNTGTANYTAEEGDTEPAPRETSSGSGPHRNSFELGTNSLETDHNYGTRYNLSNHDNVVRISSDSTSVNGPRYATSPPAVNSEDKQSTSYNTNLNIIKIKPRSTSYQINNIKSNPININTTKDESKLSGSYNINHNFSKYSSNSKIFDQKNKAQPRLTIYDAGTFKTSLSSAVRENESDAEKAASSSGSRVAKSAYPYGSTSHYRTFERGYNSQEQTPPDPFVALFLSHYGKYLPAGRGSLGDHYNNLYSYLASNNLHNNKPFGSYKIYEDTDG